MIDFIRGKLVDKEISHVSIETHGVGYGISIPLSTYEKLPGPGEEVFLHIHYHVREDAHKLYGFFSKGEREMFRQLIAITKIGPKVALNVLSGISISDLVSSINSQDSSRLEKIPGIGARTAERLVMELKGKLSSSDLSSSTSVPLSLLSTKGGKGGGMRNEAFAAMISLGYNDKQVTKAISRVEETINGDAPVEEWIRKALQVI